MSADKPGGQTHVRTEISDRDPDVPTTEAWVNKRGDRRGINGRHDRRVKNGSKPVKMSGVTPLNAENIEMMAQMMLTVGEMSALCHCKTRHIKNDPELMEAIERGHLKARAALRRRQWTEAMRGAPAMLVWLGKQYLEQKDKATESVDENDLVKAIMEARRIMQMGRAQAESCESSQDDEAPRLLS